MDLIRRQLNQRNRETLLEYFDAASRIRAFQDKEARRYTATTERLVTANHQPVSEIHLEAAERMMLADGETVTRFERLDAGLLSAAKGHFKAWGNLFFTKAQLSMANFDSLVLAAKGQAPDSKRQQIWRRRLATAEEDAEKETRRLIETIGVAAAEFYLIQQSVERSLRSEAWNPESSVVGEVFEVLKTAVDGLLMYETVLGMWGSESDDSAIDQVVNEAWIPDWRRLQAWLAPMLEVGYGVYVTDVREKVTEIYSRMLAFEADLMEKSADAGLKGLPRIDSFQRMSSELRTETAEYRTWAREAGGTLDMEIAALEETAARRSRTFWQERMHLFFNPEREDVDEEDTDVPA
jgi:hypothetical protein